MNEKTLTQQGTSDNDFLVGDVVVFDEKHSMRDDLLAVDAVLDGGRYLGLSDYRYALPVDRVRHATAEEIQASKRLATIQSMGDDAHIENHVSPLCITDSTNHIESCYIGKKKQVELLQTEIARLNAIVERQKAEMVVMQVEIDLLNKTVEAVKREFCIFYEFTKLFNENTDTATMAGTMAGFAENIEEILGGVKHEH